MASLSWIDDPPNGQSGHFHTHQLAKLRKQFLEPVRPSEAISRSFRLARLCLLSNHIEQAKALLCALYTHYDAILPPTSDAASGPQLWVTSAEQYFWHTHPDIPRPDKLSDVLGRIWAPGNVGEHIARQQWSEYRECTRTGWMLEHCSLAEPEDPHLWRDSNDEAMIAMCARLLAKDKTPGRYPSDDKTREALEAARRLYARPQPQITEWTVGSYKGPATVRRHSFLLYRRLVVELAIRLGELDAAADLLGMGLRLDGFNSVDGGQLERYLFLPGIYDVLPLLAKRGKLGNPYYIERVNAISIVGELVQTVELRARQGRQWSLAPEKVGWDELLHRLARGAWKVNRREYKRAGLTCATEILFEPATEGQIKAAEDEVGELPTDFKDMLRVSNGFLGGWHFLEGGLAGLDGIRLAQEDVDTFIDDFGVVIEDCELGGTIELRSGADECDGFQHFMVPPGLWSKAAGEENTKEGEYRYWNWASWRASSNVFESVRDWVASLVEKVEDMVEKGEKCDDGTEEEDAENESDDEDCSTDEDNDEGAIDEEIV